MNIALQIHPNKNKVDCILPNLIKFLTDNQCKVFVLDNDKEFFSSFDVILLDDVEEFMTNSIELLMSVGGDGTYIGAAKKIVGYNVPILGLHMGGLGFLAEVLIENFENKLKDFFRGKYRIEQRKILEAEIAYLDKKKKYNCINDLLINRHENMSMAKFVTYVDGDYLNTYRGDGVIISTPAGSTAYNMSAGGPIISPQLDVITLTPVCPHSLSARPVIIGGNQAVTFYLADSKNRIALDIDGQERIYLDNALEVNIRNSNASLNIVRFQDYSFFHTLQTKFNWGVDPRNK